MTLAERMLPNFLKSPWSYESSEIIECVTHTIRKVEDEQIGSWRTWSLGIGRHIVKIFSAEIRLRVVSAVHAVDHAAWRGSLVLGLLRDGIPIVVLILVKDFVKACHLWDYIHRISKLLTIRFAVVLLLFEPDLNGNSAAVEECLAVEEFDCQQGTFFLFVLDECPILGLLQVHFFHITQ